MHRSSEAGYTLVEILVVLGIGVVMAAVMVPSARAFFAETHVLAAARKFKWQFLKTRSDAVRSNEYRAIRFESCDSGDCYSVYRDGDGDGVLRVDIERGRDVRVAGPFALSSGAPGVRIGINPGVRAIPPETGLLTGDPIRFGRAEMISFSPLGGATPGTFYLAGDGAQAAVRVHGGTGRVRMMFWRGYWKERP
jgi:type II secretory pathway pseudopilin PulG